jgi:phosphoribosylformylglycinamidine cyclo-ligase
VGFKIDRPLPVSPLFRLIATRAQVTAEELWETFNMGCGFCCVVPAEQAGAAVELLASRHPGTAVVGRATSSVGVVELPGEGLRGTREGGFAPTG